MIGGTIANYWQATIKGSHSVATLWDEAVKEKRMKMSTKHITIKGETKRSHSGENMNYVFGITNAIFIIAKSSRASNALHALLKDSLNYY